MQLNHAAPHYYQSKNSRALNGALFVCADPPNTPTFEQPPPLGIAKIHILVPDDPKLQLLAMERYFSQEL